AKIVDVPEPVVHGEPAPSLAPTLPANAKATEHGRVMGTPSYMAPEQARGEPVDARAAVFAFGVVLYDLPAGVAPLRRTRIPSCEETSGDWAIAARVTRLAPRAPRAVDGFVLRCLAFDRTARFSDGAALVAELERVTRRGAARRRASIAAGAVTGA